MSDRAQSLSQIAAWPEVAEVLAAARDACTALRFHEGLRRRIPEAAAESRVRGAHASAELDGARSDVGEVRDLMRGAVGWGGADPGRLTLRGAVQVTAEAEHLAPILARSPMQALARLHLAAASPLSEPQDVGRPRGAGEPCAEFADLGPAPDDPAPRLAALVELLAVTDAPALVVAALAHAEIAAARPFPRANGLVARAVERVLVISRGLDPTGVAVPEAGHRAPGQHVYAGALAAYATGTREGVGLWVRHCGESLVRAAQEGQRVADAVRAGRLT